MKILTLFAQHHWTGPAEPEMEKLATLQQMGHEVYFCFSRFPDGTLKNEIGKYNFKTVDKVMLNKKKFSPFGFRKDVALLEKACRAEKIDIIHCHLSHDHWTGRLLSRKLGHRIPLVRSIHESRKLRPNLGDKLLYRSTDGFLVPARSFADKLAVGFNLHWDHIGITPGVVDVERFRPGMNTGKILKELGVTSKTPLIGMVSRIKPGRGHQELFEAFKVISKKHPKARLVIVGKGELKDKFVREYSALVSENKVHFLGYRRDDLPEILNALSVKVILGEGSDGTCRAALEAMACAIPVIAAKVGVLPETVLDRGTGLLVNLSDKGSLHGALLCALEHPDELKVMGTQGREVVLKRNTISESAKLVEHFYHKMVFGREK